MFMFKKLNATLNIDVDYVKGNLSHSVAPVFYEFSIKNKDYIYKILEKKFNFKIKPLLINLTEIHNPGVIPHCDKWNVALNCYLNAGEETTFFWKEKNSKISYLKNLHGTLMYSIDNLEKIKSFVAKKGDCFLINTHQIHSVEVIDTPRIILRFIWFEQDFEKILNSIEILE
jgi:hypothetical protein